MRLLKKILSALTLALIAGLPAAVSAGPADQIEYRKKLFSAVGGHMTAMKLILQGKAGMIEDLPRHANAMAGLSKAAKNAFPKGSGPEAGKTRAKAKIWEDTAEFNKALVRWEEKAAALAEIVKTGDKAKAFAAFGEMGDQGCGGCHKPFREPKK